MAKQAIYMEEARRLYVQEGFSLDTIVGMLGKNVSRKTLYNWKETYEWDKKRREYVEQTKELHLEIRELVKLTLQNAKANPTPKNLSSFARAIAAMKVYEGVKLLEEETTPKERQELTKEIIEKIEKDLNIT